MKSARIVPAVIFLLLLAASLTASVGQVQIYGIVERVVLEPNERAPERIKIWGAFALLYTNQEPVRSSDGPYAPHRGYLYFKLPPIARGDTKKIAHETARKEWADLKAVAGTGQAITFGSWTSSYLGLAPNSRSENGFVGGPSQKDTLRVYDEKERSGKPIPYTMDTGIVKIPKEGNRSVLIEQLKRSLEGQRE
jgi:hypothetical protein